MPLPLSLRNVPRVQKRFIGAVALCNGHQSGTKQVRIRVPAFVRRYLRMNREDIWMTIDTDGVKRRVYGVLATIVFVTNVLFPGMTFAQVPAGGGGAEKSGSESEPATEISEVLDRIAGTLFEDLNRNGVRDDGENGIPDVTLDVLQGEESIGRMVTGEDGAYAFENLSLEGTEFGEDTSTDRASVFTR